MAVITVIVAYDVGSDGRRARLAALLQAWGDRIQYSVFLCTLQDDALGDLRAEVARIVDADEDSVFVIRQCGTCSGAMVTFGQGARPTRERYWGVF